jgi:hypothetical protein
MLSLPFVWEALLMNSSTKLTDSFRRTICLSAADLAQLNAVFSTIRKGWSQRVDTVYTYGKMDTIWREAGVAASELGTAGVKVCSKVDERSRALSATIALDLKCAEQLAQTNNKPANRISSVSVATTPSTFQNMQERLLGTLQHELLHVLQHWIYGDEWGSKYADANRKGYDKNRYEQAAFRHGEWWVRTNRERIAAGTFERYIPKTGE